VGAIAREHQSRLPSKKIFLVGSQELPMRNNLAQVVKNSGM